MKRAAAATIAIAKLVPTKLFPIKSVLGLALFLALDILVQILTRDVLIISVVLNPELYMPVGWILFQDQVKSVVSFFRIFPMTIPSARG